jgi:hypothetical protein
MFNNKITTMFVATMLILFILDASAIIFLNKGYVLESQIMAFMGVPEVIIFAISVIKETRETEKCLQKRNKKF